MIVLRSSARSPPGRVRGGGWGCRNACRVEIGPKEVQIRERHGVAFWFAITTAKKMVFGEIYFPLSRCLTARPPADLTQWRGAPRRSLPADTTHAGNGAVDRAPDNL